jgi:hypothetical protein
MVPPPGDGAEAGRFELQPPRLAGLNGSPTSDVSSVAHEPARLALPPRPCQARSIVPGRRFGADSPPPQGGFSAIERARIESLCQAVPDAMNRSDDLQFVFDRG